MKKINELKYCLIIVRNSHDFLVSGKQRQLAGKMRELSSEIHRIKTDGEGKALADTQEELAETKEIKDKVVHDLEKAKKVGARRHV